MKLKKLKRYINLRNIAIILCVAAVIVGLYFVLKPEGGKTDKTGKTTTASGIEVVDTKVKENDEISEEKAKDSAEKQFKKLGEKVSKNDLTIKKIKRQGEEYYYITSKENTMEIKIKGGKVTRINSAPVEE